MTNDIIKGIIKALNDEFGTDETRKIIYKDVIRQGIITPCFLITSLKPSNARFLGDRRKINTQFSIQYFVSEDALEPLQECNDVADRLMYALEMIEVDGNLIHGTNPDVNISDEVLTFTINYNFFGYKVTDKEPAFENIDVKGGLKNG